MNRIHRIVLSGSIAVVVGGGIVVASAATLGTVTSTKLGAGNVEVGSCDSDGVSVSYTYAYNPADTHQRYEVSGATVSNIAGTCDGKSISVTLTGASGVSLGTSTAATIPTGGASTVAFATPASAEAVQGASVLISG